MFLLISLNEWKRNDCVAVVLLNRRYDKQFGAKLERSFTPLFDQICARYVIKFVYYIKRV